MWVSVGWGCGLGAKALGFRDLDLFLSEGERVHDADGWAATELVVEVVLAVDELQLVELHLLLHLLHLVAALHNLLLQLPDFLLRRA